MKCPRRDETPQSAYHDRDDDVSADGKRCEWCGSMMPDEFFAAIEAGCRLGPTDKSYKVYVYVPNPLAGQTVEVGKEYKDGVTTPIMGMAGSDLQKKFYFQHLNADQRELFVMLMNSGRLNLDAPGYFYRLPFFCVPARPPRLEDGVEKF